MEPKMLRAKVIGVDVNAENPLGGIGVMEVWANTEEVDLYRELTKATAFQSSIDRFESTGKWPPFLATHTMVWENGGVPVLGRLFKAEVIEGKGVKAWLAFAPESVQPMARRWMLAYAGGWLTDVSVGFISKAHSFPEVKADTDPVMIHDEVFWFELSGGAVGIEVGSVAISVAETKSLKGAPDDVRELVTSLRALKDSYSAIRAPKHLKASDDKEEKGEHEVDENDEEFSVKFDHGDIDDDSKRTLALVDAEEKSVHGHVANVKSEDDGKGDVVLMSAHFNKKAGWKTLDDVKDFAEHADFKALLKAAVKAEHDDEEEEEEEEDAEESKASKALLAAAARFDAATIEIKCLAENFDRGIARINKMHEAQVILSARLAVVVDEAKSSKTKTVPAVSRSTQGAPAVTSADQKALDSLADDLRKVNATSRGSSDGAVRDARESREG